MATHRVSILGGGTVPDGTGDCWFEPYFIVVTNDQWRNLIVRFGTSIAAEPTSKHGIYGQFQVPPNYASAANLVLIWTSPVTGGNVEWDFRYRAVANGESLDQTTQDEDVNSADAGPGTAHFRLEHIQALTDGNFVAGDTVTFYLTRDGTDAGDDLVGPAILFDAYFEYSD
jgi:hypothetical protein